MFAWLLGERFENSYAQDIFGLDLFRSKMSYDDNDMSKDVSMTTVFTTLSIISVT